ncbi:MAG: hypothetical protein IJJ06_07130 [Mogibacterium sp.]|nr:hypothetical protein [Mogibacterium sp.]
MKNGRQNYDWEKIKIDYISDPSSSLKKIADKYHIRLNTVEKRSKADGWYAEKRKYQKSISAEIKERVYSAQTDALEQELRAVNLLEDILLEALKDKQQFNRYIVRTSNGQEEKIFSKMDTHAMLNMMKAIKLMVDVKKSILGITSIEHEDRMEIMRARLQLERERLEWEKQKANYGKPDGENCQIGIVILPEVKDESEEDAAERAKILKDWCS